MMRRIGLGGAELTRTPNRAVAARAATDLRTNEQWQNPQERRANLILHAPVRARLTRLMFRRGSSRASGRAANHTGLHLTTLESRHAFSIP